MTGYAGATFLQFHTKWSQYYRIQDGDIVMPVLLSRNLLAIMGESTLSLAAYEQVLLCRALMIVAYVSLGSPRGSYVWRSIWQTLRRLDRPV